MPDQFGPPSFGGTVADYLDAGRDARAGGSQLDDPGQPEYSVAFVDSSALVALADAGDSSHQAAVAAYHELRSGGYHLFTTDYMMVETYELLRAGPGPEIARDWLRRCRLATYHVEPPDLAAAKQRLSDEAASTLSSLIDAISLAVMDRLGVTDVFAVDQSVLQAIS